MKNLTICFYENPAALHEIDEWHKSFINKIDAYDSFNNRKIHIFYIKDYEVLICIPNNDLNLSHLYKIRKESKNLKYKKLLLFGSFNPEHLIYISNFIYHVKNKYTGEQ